MHGRVRRLTGYAAGVLLLAFPLAACSVKEDRAPCPCYLVLDMDGMAHNPDYPQGLVTIMSGQVISQERITLSDHEGTGYEKAVPRRLVDASCAAGHEDLWWHTDTLYAATGLEWGPVMLACAQVDCNDDLRHVRMDFRKEHCRVTFMLVGVTDADSYPFDLRVRANSCGVRMRDRRPVDGRYTVYARRGNTAFFHTTLPRQSESEIALDLLMHSDTHEYTPDDLVVTLDMGRMLRDQGYDWTRDDLEDVYVTVDVVKATATISIQPWDRSEVREEI